MVTAIVLARQPTSSLLSAPAGQPPPGVVPNFHDPQSLVPLATALYAVTFTIMTLAVAMRLFVRWCLVKKYLIEDFFVLIAWALMIAYGVCSHRLGKIGFTVHIWNETKATYVHGKELITIISIIYNFIIIFLKTAILAQFLRIFAPNRINAVMFYTCWALIITNVAVFVIDTILSLVRCSPVERNWNFFVSGHCRFSEFSFRISTPAVNVGTDALILVLPLPYLLKLQMNLKKKVMVVSLFAIGICATAASSVRLYYTYVVLKGTDPTWNYAYQGICTWFEVSMGSLVVCLPIAPAFFQFLREKHQTLRYSKNSKDSSGPSTVRNPNQAEKGFASPDVAVPKTPGISSFRQYMGANGDSLFTDDDHPSVLETEGEMESPVNIPKNNVASHTQAVTSRNDSCSGT